MKVDSLEFSFPSIYRVAKYDEEFVSFKRLSSGMQFGCECYLCPSHECKKSACANYSECTRKRKNEGLKGVDLIVRTDTHLYLIESKDYRNVLNPPFAHIVAEVAKKFRDTLFGIWCGGICEEDTLWKNFLKDCRMAELILQFVFHFESPTTSYPSGLYRKKKVVPLRNIHEELKKKLGPMGGYITVEDMDSMESVPWTVTES